MSILGFYWRINMAVVRLLHFLGLQSAAEWVGESSGLKDSLIQFLNDPQNDISSDSEF